MPIEWDMPRVIVPNYHNLPYEKRMEVISRLTKAWLRVH